MTRLSEPILIINDGSLAALVACLLVPDLTRVTAWVPPSGSSLRGVGVDEATQMSVISQQADLLGYERVITPPPLARPVPERWIEQAQSLLAAVSSARDLRCTRVVWPVIAGERIAEMLECSERASLVNRLCWLGENERQSAMSSVALERHSTPGGSGTWDATMIGIRLETPFVDLIPSQVADMARDLDAPLQACWWTAEAMV